jgi:predicted AlkP superfamily phosphohydrolase/phosphomutase
MATPRRVAVIGLDGVPPELLFDKHSADMPTLTRLKEKAVWGPMRSIDPPITMPAWACMLSGATPGELGIYGFRDRADHGYGPMEFATARKIRRPRIWDLVSAAGGTSIVLGVPGTYPTTPILGSMVSCFMAPSTDARFTHPVGLADELAALTGGYRLDVANFRSPEPERISQEIFDMSEQRFDVARHLATTREWDLLTFVDMGPDRLHHAFWKHCDPEHPRHEPGNRHADLFTQYYRALDRQIAGLLETLPEDTAVMVVSDHGAQPMVGGFRVNEWLRREGLLVLREEPDHRIPLAKASVDWTRTVAWAEGGYYGRVFLNVEGREPTGTVPAAEHEDTADRIARMLEALTDETGAPMRNRVLRPHEIYPEVNGVAPDLMVYFGDLRRRALATLGGGEDLHTTENDTGPDHANHGDTGVFLLAGTGASPGPRPGLSLYDVAPTLESLLGVESPVRHSTSAGVLA